MSQFLYRLGRFAAGRPWIVIGAWFAAAVIVEQTERGDRMFMQMVTGGAHQILDNDALDVLPN